MRSKLMVSLALIALISAVPALADDGEIAERHFQDGVGFFEKGQYERASYHLEKAYRISEKWQHLEYVARTWLALGNYENATHALDGFLRKGGSAIPAAKRAWAKKELRRLGKEKGFQGDKKDADELFRTARELFTKGDYEKAAIELEKAYDLNPTWGYLDLIGRTELALDNLDRAAAAFGRFLAECGEEATEAQRDAVKKLLGEIEVRLAAEKKKEEAEARFREGRKLLEAKDYAGAAPVLELAYSLHPNWEYLDPIGAALAGVGANRRAAEAYSAYLQAGGGNVPPEQRAAVSAEIKRLSGLAAAGVDVPGSQAESRRGAELMRGRKYAEALAAFQLAYELNPDIRLFISIAQADEALGRHRDAIRLYDRYLAAAGAGVPAATKVEVDRRLGALKEKIAAEERRARAQVFFQSGTALYEQRAFEKAVIDFNKAYEIDPAFQILPSIAEAEAELKNYDRAVRTLEQYLADGGARLGPRQRGFTQKRIAYFQSLGRGETPAWTEGEAPERDELGQDAADRDLEQILSAGPGGAPAPGAKEEKKSDYWSPHKRLWTWILGGAGLACFGGSIATGVVARNEQEKVDDVCPGGVCPPEYIDGAQDRQDTVGDLRISTRVLFTAGSVGLAAGITLFFVEPLFARGSGSEVAIVPLLGDGDAGLTVAGRF